MATELAKAYVQIVPSAKGIQGQLESELSGQMRTAGDSAGGSLASSVAAGMIKANVWQWAAKEAAKIVSEAFTGYQDYEQLVGGVETLFKDSAGTVEEYAKTAYKRAGISGNEYMEQATSFAAALVNSLGGDTERAAEMADLAILDMADNANKMGTDLGSIQNAYQGFAKFNFTMLDNLKLGGKRRCRAA